MTMPVILAIILIAAVWAVIIPLAIQAHRTAKLDALARGMQAFAAACDGLADNVRRMGEAFTSVGTASLEARKRATDSFAAYLASGES